MKMRFKSYPLDRSGFTLIEVVASLLLVGTLLVAVLMAHRRSAHQTRTAEQRLAAIAALDDLLMLRANPSQDAAGEEQLPAGKIPGSNPFQWRTAERHDSAAELLGAVILRMEVFDPNYEQGVTLASVELLVPGIRPVEASDERP